MLFVVDFVKMYFFCEFVIYILLDCRGCEIFKCWVVYFIVVIFLVVEIISMEGIVVVFVYMIKLNIFLDKGLVEDYKRCVYFNYVDGERVMVI